MLFNDHKLPDRSWRPYTRNERRRRKTNVISAFPLPPSSSSSSSNCFEQQFFQSMLCLQWHGVGAVSKCPTHQMSSESDIVIYGPMFIYTFTTYWHTLFALPCSAIQFVCVCVSSGTSPMPQNAYQQIYIASSSLLSSSFAFYGRYYHFYWWPLQHLKRSVSSISFFPKAYCRKIVACVWSGAVYGVRWHCLFHFVFLILRLISLWKRKCTQSHNRCHLPQLIE